MPDKPLGRRIPQDFVHIAKYPFSAIAPTAPITVEKNLQLPFWHWSWDQGSEGACVGFGCSMMISILKEMDAKKANHHPLNPRFDPIWLWNQAKIYDEFPDTNPGDNNGTTVRAGCDVLRKEGHVQVIHKIDQPVSLNNGILENRWATNVDQIRLAISQNTPVAIGINWYTNFDKPILKNKDYYIGLNDLGSIRGGHCVCVYGASDKKQAVVIKNSWGKAYPLVWLPYSVLERLLQEEGEATLVTDRV